MIPNLIQTTEPVGEELRQRRLAAGMDLKSVAVRSGLYEPYIDLLERTQLYCLPLDIDRPAFAAAYLRAIGITSQAEIDSFTSSLMAAEPEVTSVGLTVEPPRIEAAPAILMLGNRSSGNNLTQGRAMVVASVLLLCGIGVTHFFLSEDVPDPATEAVAVQPDPALTDLVEVAQDPNSRPMAARPKELQVDPLPSHATSESQEAVAEAHDWLPASLPEDVASVVLDPNGAAVAGLQDANSPAVAPVAVPNTAVLVATQQVWLRVGQGSTGSREMTLQPGETLNLDLTEAADLHIGNAGGVELTLYGQLQPPLGASGEVKKMRLEPVPLNQTAPVATTTASDQTAALAAGAAARQPVASAPAGQAGVAAASAQPQPAAQVVIMPGARAQQAPQAPGQAGRSDPAVARAENPAAAVTPPVVQAPVSPEEAEKLALAAERKKATEQVQALARKNADPNSPAGQGPPPAPVDPQAVVAARADAAQPAATEGQPENAVPASLQRRATVTGSGEAGRRSATGDPASLAEVRRQAREQAADAGRAADGATAAREQSVAQERAAAEARVAAESRAAAEQRVAADEKAAAEQEAAERAAAEKQAAKERAAAEARAAAQEKAAAEERAAEEGPQSNKRESTKREVAEERAEPADPQAAEEPAEAAEPQVAEAAREKKAAQEKADQEKAAEEKAAQEKVAQEKKPAAGGKPSPGVLRATDEVWVRIENESGEIEEMLLQEGETVDLSKASNLVVGNAGGVELTVDGQTQSLGEKGEVRRMKLSSSD